MKKPEQDPLKRRVLQYAAENRGVRRHSEVTLRQQRRAIRRLAETPEVARVVAPAWFSTIDNPDYTIAFFQSVQKLCRSGRRLFVDLSRVTRITSDAIAGLIFAINGAHVTRTAVQGSLPSDESIRRRILASGFADYVSVARGRSEVVPRGVILKQVRQTVDNRVAAQLVDHAKAHVATADHVTWATAYGNLIECMANTKNHAAKRAQRFSNPARESTPQDPERWLAAVENLECGGVAFTFIDFGSGILETAGRKEQFVPLFGASQATALRNILDAKVISSTGNPRRGKGLPRIASSAERSNFVDRVVVIANGAFASPAAPGGPTYFNLSTPFSGTMIYWKVAPAAVA